MNEKTEAMKNRKLLERTLRECVVPKKITYCFLSECPRKDECIHYQCQFCRKPEKKRGSAVFPNALNDDGCEFFAPLRVVRMAWGFERLFAYVKVKDAKILREKMRTLLGSKGQYYRYRSGRLRLIPEQQQQVKDLFAEYGYHDADFDDFAYEIDFTKA